MGPEPRLGEKIRVASKKIKPPLRMGLKPQPTGEGGLQRVSLPEEMLGKPPLPGGKP